MRVNVLQPDQWHLCQRNLRPRMHSRLRRLRRQPRERVRGESRRSGKEALRFSVHIRLCLLQLSRLRPTAWDARVLPAWGLQFTWWNLSVSTQRRRVRPGFTLLQLNQRRLQRELPAHVQFRVRRLQRRPRGWMRGEPGGGWPATLRPSLHCD